MEQIINANNCNTYYQFANDKDAFKEFTNMLEDIIHEYYSFLEEICNKLNGVKLDNMSDYKQLGIVRVFSENGLSLERLKQLAIDEIKKNILIQFYLKNMQLNMLSILEI